jgi:hypothetical protein
MWDDRCGRCLFERLSQLCVPCRTQPAFSSSFTKVVPTTKREAKAEWGPVNMLYQSKTLAGGDQRLEVPEEHMDTEGGFEYRKIFALFKVLSSPPSPPTPSTPLIFFPFRMKGGLFLSSRYSRFLNWSYKLCSPFFNHFISTLLYADKTFSTLGENQKYQVRQITKPC